MKKQGYVLFALMFLVVACLEKSESQDAIISVKDAVNFIPCGEFGFCPSDFVCLDEKLCCPLNMPQNCNGQCFPQDCQCVVDGEITLCLSIEMKYCGKGISCLKEEECHLDGDGYYCVGADEFYCGNGLMCQKDKEDCYFADDLNEFHCKPKGLIYCGQEKWCENWQVCPSCCPKEQPIECGKTCCYLKPNEFCISQEHSICLPQWGIWCQGEVCVAGEACAPDGLPVCYPENGDYCGDGRWCEPGWKCTSMSCCPEGTPQECGNLCCYKDFICVDNGKACISPSSEYCPETGIICDPETFCALNGTICLPDNTDVCEDGHWCEPGLFCSGSTCCSFENPTFCGDLCCPLNWLCIENGKACVPPYAQFCAKSGKWCPNGTSCASDGECILPGWTDCFTGIKCPPNFVCAGNGKKCCPKDEGYLCGDNCCQDESHCIKEKGLCLPSGAIYCDGVGPKDYCLAGFYCGKTGCIPNFLEECKNGLFCLWNQCGKTTCLPLGWEECNNGQLCPPNTLCTNSYNGPACCPDNLPVGCGDKCCSSKYFCCGNECCLKENTCLELGGEIFCVPPGAEACPSITGDLICYEGTFCAPDGYCVDDKKKLDNYCGGGNGCMVFEPAMYCGGLCTDFCCSPFKIICWDDCDKKPCCSLLGGGCINSCMPDWSICAAFPLSNSPTAYLNPKEGFYGPFSDGKGNIGPGLSKNITKDGIYHVEWDSGNWIVGSKDDVILIVEAVWIIDNLEVAWCKLFDPHGPFGKLYLRVHSLETFPKTNEIHIDWVTTKLHEYNLRGPHAGPCPCQACVDYWFGKECVCISDPVTDEWLDNQFLRYSTGKAGIYRWGEKEEAIYLSIIEGDYSNSDDIGGVELIKKEDTSTPCGIWVPFYKYETIECSGLLCSPSPKWPKKTNTIAAFLLLRTITCTGKPGDPC